MFKKVALSLLLTGCLSGCSTLPSVNDLASYIPGIPQDETKTVTDRNTNKGEPVGTAQPQVQKTQAVAASQKTTKPVDGEKSVSPKTDTLRIGKLEMNKTTVRTLPRLCFNSYSLITAYSPNKQWHEPQYLLLRVSTNRMSSRREPIALAREILETYLLRLLISGPMPGTVVISSLYGLSECFGRQYHDVTASFADGLLYRLIISEEGQANLLTELKSTIPGLRLVKKDSYHNRYEYDSKDYKVEYHPTSDTVHQYIIESKWVNRKITAFLKTNGYPKLGRFTLNRSTKQSLEKYMAGARFYQTKSDIAFNTYRGPVDIHLFGTLPFGVGGTETQLIFNKKNILKKIRLYPIRHGSPAMTVDEFIGRTAPTLTYEGTSASTLYTIPSPAIRPVTPVDHIFFHKAYSPAKTQTIALFRITLHADEATRLIHAITIENPYFSEDF